MSSLQVLVSGGGIAGSVVASWLGKAGIDVTVLEKASELRMSGQGIDIRGRGLDVIKGMGVEDKIKALTTKEAGLRFIDDKNNALATLDVTGDQGFTAEIEIIRGDLAKIFYDASISTGRVKYEFDVSVTAISQTTSNVSVDLSNGQTRQYDLLISADGFGSRTRQLILGHEKSKSCLKSLNSYVAYFTIPSEEQDSPRSRWCPLIRSRAATLRPRGPGRTSAYLTFFTNSAEPRNAINSNNMDVQKKFISETFADVRWEVPRILREMQNCGPEDFYFQEVGQIVLDPSSWHQGRCALVGDAAYCPSPFTGMGTTLAIIGAYVLAGEIVAQHKSLSSADLDYETAFKNYEAVMGDYVKDIQKLPLGGYLVSMLNPYTGVGLWVLRTLLWVVDWSGILKLASSLSGGEVNTEGLTLKEYEF